MGMSPRSDSAVAADSIADSIERVADCPAIVSVLDFVAWVGEPTLLDRDFDAELVVYPIAMGSR